MLFVIHKRGIFAMLSVIFLLLVAALNTPQAVTTLSKREQIPIYCVKTADKKIAITFDSAWDDGDLTEILDSLEKYGCRATFFVVGDFVEKYPQRIEEMHKKGHEIANHSDTHPHPNSLTREQLILEMDGCDKKIREITKQKDVLFRAPYGEYNDLLVNTCGETGRFCIQWDVDSLDWRGLTAERITQRVTEGVKNGSIVLLHNGADNTAKALPDLLCRLKNLGYEFVTVSQLIYKEDYYIDHTGMQIPA